MNLKQSIKTRFGSRTCKVIVAGAFFCAAINSTLAVSPKGSQWILKQTYVDAGPQDVYITHDAIKIVSHHFGYHALAKAPTWTVNCFRPKEKIEWVGAMDVFSGRMLENPFAVDGDKLIVSLKVDGTGLINGMRYTKYTEVNVPRAYIYGSDDIVVSPRIPEFICRYYDMPDVPKVPVHRRYDKGNYETPIYTKGDNWRVTDFGKDLRHGLIDELTTQSFKKVPLNSKDFELPPGLKRVSTLGEVSYSNKQKDTMKDIFDGYGDPAQKDISSDSKSKAVAPSGSKRR